MSLTINEYQKRAWSTAVYNDKGNNLEYICLGLGGESGEIQEYLKKTLHRNQSNNTVHLKGEFGDLLWYLAGAASECKLQLAKALNATLTRKIETFGDFQQFVCEYYYRFGTSAGSIALHLNRHVAKLQECLDTFRPGNETPYPHIFRCFEWLTVLCHIYCFSLEDVALYNLEKLASRKERGVLKGEGDNR